VIHSPSGYFGIANKKLFMMTADHNKLESPEGQGNHFLFRLLLSVSDSKA